MIKIKQTFAFLISLMLMSSSAFASNIINLAEGGAQTIKVNSEIKTIFIADPKIADYQIVDKNKIVVFGKALGSTSLLAFDAQSNTITNKKIVVNKSLDSIQQQIQLKYPYAEVSIYNLGEQVVLSGTVATEQGRDEINIMVGELLKKESDDYKMEWKLQGDDDDDYEMEFMKRQHFKGLVNNIEVATVKQVNVKLSIAEVSQSFMEEFGIQLGSKGQSSGIFVNALTSFSASDIITVISAIGDDSVGQILAEPNLSVISGESASFLVGGELPVVTIVDGGTNVTYKEFGIRLDMMAKVHRNDKINLSLLPEVSSLDSQYTNEQYNLPVLKTRRARTTVELGDGQSFILAGLLSSEDRESLKKIPYIGDIPVLGALFRHTSTERSKTELIIVATVNLVQPIKPSQIQLPTMQKTTNLQRFFAIEQEYTKAGDKWSQEVLSMGGFKK
jgi:pilus assembly protein CpaC